MLLSIINCQTRVSSSYIQYELISLLIILQNKQSINNSPQQKYNKKKKTRKVFSVNMRIFYLYNGIKKYFYTSKNFKYQIFCCIIWNRNG